MISRSIVVWAISLLALRRCAHLGLRPFPNFRHHPYHVFACHQLDLQIIIPEGDGKGTQSFQQIIRDRRLDTLLTQQLR